MGSIYFSHLPKIQYPMSELGGLSCEMSLGACKLAGT